MSLKIHNDPPIATRVKSICSAHGDNWVDYYAWLKPDNWQEVMEDPAKLPMPIADYLNAENAYYQQATADQSALRDELTKEIRGRMVETPESIPVRDGPYEYRYRFVENAEYPIRVRTDLNGESEEIVLDVNAQARGFAHFDLGILSHSPDHSLLMWSCDTSGGEFFTLHIRDIAKGLDMDYVIDNVDDATWADDQTIFYTHRDSSYRVHQVYKHIVGTDPKIDVLVFTETDEPFGCDVYRSLSREYIFISTSTFDQDECWFIPVNNLNATPVLIQTRMKGLEYAVQHQGDRFIICTNAQGATDWKLVEAPLNYPSIEYWTDLFAYREGWMIADFHVFEDWIVWLEIVDALPQIAYMDSNGSIDRVTIDEEAYCLEVLNQLEYKTASFVFEYSSPTTPREFYRYNCQTANRNLLKRQIIPSGHDPKDYVTRRFSVESHDGAQVPVTLLYRHDTPINGTAPALLYGYGCYGASSEAEFSTARLSLVDRGFVYAIAHVRGGSEKGMAWYEDSKYSGKANSFHDFIAVGDGLVSKDFCAAGNIVSLGESAGGLLVAASMNMKPELFAGVIAGVPDVDFLHALLDDTLPGIPQHWALFGNPIESKSAFDTIRAYSPYENTQAVAYPSIYVTAGVSDPRVPYWQAAKWVAQLRASKTDDNLVFLNTNMQSGHFGKTGRFAQIDDAARMYAFAISVTSGSSWGG